MFGRYDECEDLFAKSHSCRSTQGASHSWHRTIGSNVRRSHITLKFKKDYSLHFPIEGCFVARRDLLYCHFLFSIYQPTKMSNSHIH